MATRNLARTVIEAGRTSFSKHSRRQLRRRERREGRRYCSRAVSLEDLEEIGAAPVKIRKDWRWAQDDNLTPARRWVASKVGQPWNDIFSELSQKFRRRGIAMSHVVDIHILGWVNFNYDPRYSRICEFMVDDEGILRRNPEYSTGGRYYSWRNYSRDLERAKKWAGRRKLLVRGSKVYWTNPDIYVYESGMTEREITEVVSHRQGRELSKEEYEFYEALSPRVQQELIWTGDYYNA